VKAEKIEDEETVFISVFNAEKKILSCYKKVDVLRQHNCRSAISWREQII
jgi:hypothetical protein